MRAQWLAFYVGLSVESVLSEIEDAPIKLLGKNPELYASYDRSRAEAESVILRQQSRKLTSYANDILAEAMRVGRIDSTTVTVQLTPDELIIRQFGIRSLPKVIRNLSRSSYEESQEVTTVVAS